MSEESSIITCANCNEPLEVGWERCPTCLTPTSSTGLTCPNCQALVKAKWKECPRCQTVLSGVMTPSVGETHYPAKKSSDEERNFLSIDGPKGQTGMLGFELDLPIVEGDKLGERYRVIKKLGKGGFGTVYHVHDTDLLDRQMALKVVVAGKGKAQRATEQLLHEFNLRERINDTTYIIKAHDPRHCEYKGSSLALLPMELADGGGIRQWLALNPDTEKRRNAGIEFFKQACMGTKAIHDAKLVHLDIKPENILLVSGKAKMADFGIGRYGANQFANNPEQLLRQGIGTPQYMSPEQFHVARQKDVGPASDIYSLGIVLFEILDGNLPFDGTPIELRDKHLNMQPPRLTGNLQKWGRIIEGCLAKKAEDRYQNVERLIKDLDRAAQGAALSIDASCPECGNINTNPDARECEKCQASLDSLFRLCPRCTKPVRLDIEKCSGCGKDVASHYLLITRKEQIEKLKDEDPAEAIELLEIVLREGADDFQERAVELVKDLRQKQSQISSLISKAENAIALGIPEEAIEAWKKVLDVIQRHRVAIEQIEKLKSLMGEFTSHWDTAMEMMEQALFEDADNHLQSCLEVIPRRDEVKEMLKVCRQRSHDYTTAFDQATKALDHKLLHEAEKHIKVALSNGQNSPEALVLADKVSKTIETTSSLISQARQQLRKAEFTKVDATVHEIVKLQADNLSLPEIQKQLAQLKGTYTSSMENARSAKNAHDLDKAVAAVEEATKLCPESSEAQSLLKQIKENQQEAQDLFEKAKSVQRAAKFEQANKIFQKVSKIWPTMKGVEKADKILAEDHIEYESCMERARQANEKKDLEPALEAAKSALKPCPDSVEALELVEAIEKTQSSARNYLKKAKKFLNEAKFDEAQEQVKIIKDSWPTYKEVEQMEAQIASTSEKYSNEIGLAWFKYNQKEFTEARSACNRALSLCPKASDPDNIIYLIDDIEERKVDRKLKTRKILKSTGKWSGLIIAGAVALVILITVVVLFWRWVTGTVCPWFVANQGSLVTLCVFLSIMHGAVHRIRFTNGWIEMQGVAFFVPIVITAGIVLVSALVAVLLFHAPWTSGTAVGLVLGVIQSAFYVVYSFIDK